MRELYQQIIEYVLVAGSRLVEKSGSIEDIGTTKQRLTEEDLQIERDLSDIILSLCPDHVFFAEEEHDYLATSRSHVRVIDPISGTKTFIEGLPHYAIVVSYVIDGTCEFAVVYDPSVDQLYTAVCGEGAYCNSKKLVVQESNSLIFNQSLQWGDLDQVTTLRQRLGVEYNITSNANSFAINFCHCAAGKYGGIVSLCKDIFPIFAGELILKEAGGIVTTNMKKPIGFEDRFIIGGEHSIYDSIIELA